MQFENKMTVGNLWTIGTVVVAVIIGWTELYGRVDALETRIALLTIRLEKGDDRFQDVSERLIRIEERVVSIASSLKQQQAMQ
jgi:hypothetical protein